MASASLRCFGVGDGMACADRNHSSYLYTLGEVSLLIDCGEPLSRSFKASGTGSDSIDAVFISHLHFDHVGGFFMFIQGLWLDQRRKPLPVHLPADGIQPVRQMLRAACIFDDLLPFRLEFEPLRAGQAVVHQGARVTAFPTTHLESLRKCYQAKYPGDYAAYSFLLEGAGRRIAHSADLGAATDLEPLLAQPLDLLVCELAHFKPAEICGYLKGRPIKQVLFTHLGRPYWEQLEETRRLATKLLPDMKVAFAHDLQVVMF